jgi:hypothetical protein
MRMARAREIPGSGCLMTAEGTSERRDLVSCHHGVLGLFGAAG